MAPVADRWLSEWHRRQSFSGPGFLRCYLVAGHFRVFFAFYLFIPSLVISWVFRFVVVLCWVLCTLFVPRLARPLLWADRCVLAACRRAGGF